MLQKKSPYLVYFLEAKKMTACVETQLGSIKKKNAQKAVIWQCYLVPLLATIAQRKGYFDEEYSTFQRQRSTKPIYNKPFS